MEQHRYWEVLKKINIDIGSSEEDQHQILEVLKKINNIVLLDSLFVQIFLENQQYFVIGFISGNIVRK